MPKLDRAPSDSGTFDVNQRVPCACRHRRPMNRRSDEPPPPKPKPKRRAWQMKEALANIEEYADDLRELIRKLRGRLH